MKALLYRLFRRWHRRQEDWKLTQPWPGFDRGEYSPDPNVPRPVPGISWENRHHPPTAAARDEAYQAYARVVDEYMRRGKVVPHCDSRILHDASECEFCFGAGMLHLSRLTYGIQYTGKPVDKVTPYPCPADHAVAMGERGDHQAWPGNTPEGYRDLF